MIKYSFPWTFNQNLSAPDTLPGATPSFAPAQEEVNREQSSATSSAEKLLTLNEDSATSNFPEDFQNLLEEDPELVEEGVFDAFSLDGKSYSPEKLKAALANLNKFLTPIATGVLKNSNEQLEQEFIRAGYKAFQKNKTATIFKRENLNKVAIISIYDNNNEKAAFVCDISESIQDKIRGLQGYKKLATSTGMLFPYPYAQNVLYHMGTVSFPIDIIFVGEEGKVKKAYKNIQPGALATFGCSDVSNVIEISGGLCDALGIQVGDKVVVEKLTEASQRKFASRAFGKKLPILSTIKTASFKNLPCGSVIVPTHYSSNERRFVKTASSKDKNISAYYIDALFDHNLCGEINRHNAHRTLKNFMSKEGATSSEDLKVLKQLKKDIDSGNKIVLLSRSNKIPLNTLTDAILYKTASIFSSTPTENVDIDVVYVSESYDQDDLLNLLERRYLTDSIPVYSDKVSYSMLTKAGLNVKTAGTPVPENIKNQAKKALAFIDRAKSEVEDLLLKVKNNVDQYGKIQGNVELIKSTKGQYNESVKNLSEFAKNVLVNVRECVKLMNQIQDVTTTGEIIDSLAQASKKISDALEEIFELVKTIESENFYNDLVLKSGFFEKGVEDFVAVIERMSQHINADILGVNVLSS